MEYSWYFEYFCFGIKPEVVYLSQHISQKLCLQRVHKTINVESGVVSNVRRTTLLYFNKKLVKESSELSLQLKEFACNQYMHLVVEIECIIYYAMLIHGLSYQEAANKLGVVIQNKSGM